jgi:hypothetical protein
MHVDITLYRIFVFSFLDLFRQMGKFIPLDDSINIPDGRWFYTLVVKFPLNVEGSDLCEFGIFQFLSDGNDL